ncbi:hypothetical protein HPP92_004521 [Vanilla planifolia]|uniref:Protein RST1 n=1 Tax=Vanilla planifolia TaxID=51239 RepID=A0A835RWW3_VANPL|nr:hypothetical protein HPP92_004521 [Vanilla planifolia]
MYFPRLCSPQVVARVHAAFEKAVVDMAESLSLSQNIFIVLLAVESWKAFIQHWLKALVTYVDAKGSSIELDDSLKIANNILKICCKVAAESIPQVSANAALAVGALCLVVPSSCHATISSASNFLLKWLIGYEHEHLQWSSAISLGLIYNRLHVTDRSQKIKVIGGLLKVATNSKSHLVIGASGVGIGLACQGLLSSVEGDNSHRLMEATLLHDVIRTLSMVLNELCPCTFESLKNLTECLTLDNCDYEESSSLLHCRKLENLEGETWGVAGLVLGLGNSAVAVYRFGAVDAVLKIKDILLSWIPSPGSTKESLFANEMFDMPLAVGACLAIPSIVAFCQKVELMIGDQMDKILTRYISLVSQLLNSRKTGILYQNLLMASCVGAGSFVSYILGYGMHSVQYDDIRHLLELLRNCYAKPCPPLVHLGE